MVAEVERRQQNPRPAFWRCQTLFWEGKQWTVCVWCKGGLVSWEGDP